MNISYHLKTEDWKFFVLGLKSSKSEKQWIWIYFEYKKSNNLEQVWTPETSTIVKGASSMPATYESNFGQ